ncbi:hypothetical protein CPB84DRAFT_1826665 [Gymnopilus junonius]|uniref:F-box domain-containing protein n=1 Tax=Gymnopilus junonius TaxID=109634 RepID=A0A9P5NIW3_GYMJU|nr:hypothetical protein CPB84DRAFT_1826665 [Gymnopilus junonius]
MVMLKPHNPPIIRLNKDVLSAIFVLTADIFSYHGALNATRRTSQVCKEWRDILLDSPAIWGRLLDLGSLQWGKRRWRNEVLRRSGTSSSLWILATSISEEDNAETKIKEFLFSTLQNHWERVERLVASIDVERVHPSHWEEIYTPAPRLQVFDVELFYVDRKYEPATSLFNNVAPFLHTFHSKYIKFGPQALCFSGLRSLHIESTTLTVAELLKALSTMPMLTALRFDSFVAAEPDSDVSLPSSVSLPQFTRIRLWLDIVRCMRLLDRMILSRSCSLTIHDVRKMLSDPRTLSNFRPYFTQGLSIQAKDMAYLSGSDALPETLSLSLLTACNVSSVKALPEIELDCLEFTSADLTVNTILSSFSAITTVSSGERMLGNLLALQEKSSSILFPNLKEIRLDILNSSFFRSSDGDVTRFLHSRRDAGLPIQTLDLTSCTPDLSPHLSRLEEMTGLKILSKILRRLSNIFVGAGTLKKYHSLRSFNH